MYRVWYKIRIKKACRIAKGTTSRSSLREKTKHGNPSRLGLMDKCLDAWANNLTKALSAPLPEEVQWSAAQYEAVYVQLWVLVKETWLGRNSSDLGSHPESREQLVKSVVREFQLCSGLCSRLNKGKSYSVHSFPLPQSTSGIPW